MKFQLDQQLGGNTISRIEPDCIWVNGQPWTSSVLVPWQGAELVILGSGAKLRFAQPSLYRGLIESRIGIETMDLGAACRTYNVLAAEGRSVLAALLIEA